jgi:hypothetical protein
MTFPFLLYSHLQNRFRPFHPKKILSTDLLDRNGQFVEFANSWLPVFSIVQPTAGWGWAEWG